MGRRLIRRKPSQLINRKVEVHIERQKQEFNTWRGAWENTGQPTQDTTAWTVKARKPGYVSKGKVIPKVRVQDNFSHYNQLPNGPEERTTINRYYDLPANEMPLEREKPKRKIFRRGPYLENFYPKNNIQAVDGMLMKIIRRFGYDSPKTTQLIEFWARRKSGVLQKLLKNYVHKETKIIPKQEFVQFANNFDLYFCGGSNVTKTYWEQAKIGLGILYKDLKKQNPALFKRLEDYVTKKQVHKQRESSLYSENLDDFYDAYLLFRRNGLLNHHIWR